MVVLDPKNMIASAARKWERLQPDAQVALRIAYRQAVTNPEYVCYYNTLSVITDDGVEGELHLFKIGYATFVIFSFDHLAIEVILDFTLRDGINPYLPSPAVQQPRPPVLSRVATGQISRVEPAAVGEPVSMTTLHPVPLHATVQAGVAVHATATISAGPVHVRTRQSG